MQNLSSTAPTPDSPPNPASSALHPPKDDESPMSAITLAYLNETVENYEILLAPQFQAFCDERDRLPSLQSAKSQQRTEIDAAGDDLFERVSLEAAMQKPRRHDVNPKPLVSSASSSSSLSTEIISAGVHAKIGKSQAQTQSILNAQRTMQALYPAMPNGRTTLRPKGIFAAFCWLLVSSIVRLAHGSRVEMESKQNLGFLGCKPTKDETISLDTDVTRRIPSLEEFIQREADSDDAKKLRFTVELEFIQCLARPSYLQYLAHQGYFSKPSFMNFLTYLRYWKRPDYARFITFPYCLRVLDWLLEPKTKLPELLIRGDFVAHMEQMMRAHWLHYRNNRTNIPQDRLAAIGLGDHVLFGDIELPLQQEGDQDQDPATKESDVMDQT